VEGAALLMLVYAEAVAQELAKRNELAEDDCH